MSDYVKIISHACEKAKDDFVYSIKHKNLSNLQHIRAEIMAQDKKLLLNKMHDLSNICPQGGFFKW